MASKAIPNAISFSSSNLINFYALFHLPKHLEEHHIKQKTLGGGRRVAHVQNPPPLRKNRIFPIFPQGRRGGGESVHRLVEGVTREWGMIGWKVLVLKGWELGEIGGNYATMFNISQSK